MRDHYEDPVTDLPFSTRSLQLEKLDLPTKMTPSKGRTKFTEEQNAMMTITGSRNATWWGTLYHNVTAMVGAGVLGLPYAMTYLGWPGGILSLLFAWAVSLFTFQFLVYMHEHPNGERMDRYHELTREVFGATQSWNKGDFWGTWLLVPFQVTLFVGLPITYAVTGGQSLHKVYDLLAPDPSNNLRVSWWIVIFSGIQLCISQIKNFHDLTWISLFGAIASVFYSMVAFGTSVSIGRVQNVDYSVVKNRSTDDMVFGVFNALATMMFAYGGHNIALEIQATLPSTDEHPSTVKRMMRGVYAAFILTPVCYYTVAISGYWSFGRTVEPNILLSLGKPVGLIAAANIMVALHVLAGYQVYAFPILDMFDAIGIRRGFNVGTWYWRAVVRSTFVIIVCVLACAIPFFGDLMGFLGALAVTPTTYIMPCVLWLKVKKPKMTDWTFWFCYITLPISAAIMIIGSIGSIRSIIVSASTFGSFP